MTDPVDAPAGSAHAEGGFAGPASPGGSGGATPTAAPHSRIVAFRRDTAGDWIAALDCGHERHVRHDPPWQSRPWVERAAGRAAAVGRPLRCGLCERERP